MVPLAVSPNEGRRDEVCLLGDNEVTLRGGVDLPLSDQHVECVPQNLHTWSRDAYRTEKKRTHAVIFCFKHLQFFFHV